ncbi:MAG: ABC transporter permease [Myxococcales bacterium]|nr:ABC transporter permease [Myxococcales bacterium]
MLRRVRRQVADTLRVGAMTLYYLARGQRQRGAVLAQMFEVGNRSVVFTVLTLGFLGAIITLQAGFQALRIIGDTSLVGPQSLPLLVRQLGPTLTGLMVATRVGTGIAAEVGSMVVTEQVDALRMNNAPPVDYLIKPRFVACLVMIPALTVVGIASAFVAGMFTAQAAFHTQPAVYARFDVVKLSDLAEGLSKAVAFGAVIPIIAGASGLMARGGSAGVGEATTRAVVYSSLAVIVLDFVLGGLAFLVFA